MTEDQMIELVQQHHPDIGETQIKLWFSQAYEEISDRTTFSVEGNSTFSTVDGTMYYDFDELTAITDSDNVLKVNRVDYDDDEIQLIRNPEHLEEY